MIIHVLRDVPIGTALARVGIPDDVKVTSVTRSRALSNCGQEVMVMLVLTRKRSEMIRIGDDIVIKVIKSSRSCVKIGIEAPSNVRVLRAELVDRDPRALPADVGAARDAPCGV